MCGDQVSPPLRRPCGALLGGLSVALCLLTLSGCTLRHTDRAQVRSESTTPVPSVAVSRTGRVPAQKPEASVVGSPRCTGAQLKISVKALHRPTAVGLVVIEFRNGATTACWLAGYPQVSVIRGPADEKVAIRARSAGYPPDEVVLTNRSPASALLGPADGGGRCNRSRPRPLRLTVTSPDGSRKRLDLPAVPSCGPMIVNPIVPGADGSMVG